MCDCPERPAQEEDREVRSRRRRSPRWLPRLTLTKLEQAANRLLLAVKVSDVLDKHGGPHVGTLAEVLDAIARMLGG